MENKKKDETMEQTEEIVEETAEEEIVDLDINL